MGDLVFAPPPPASHAAGTLTLHNRYRCAAGRPTLARLRSERQDQSLRRPCAPPGLRELPSAFGRVRLAPARRPTPGTGPGLVGMEMPGMPMRH